MQATIESAVACEVTQISRIFYDRSLSLAGNDYCNKVLYIVATSSVMYKLTTMKIVILLSDTE